MKRLGYLFLFRKILVLHPKSYTLYKFWLGKCYGVQSYVQEPENKVLLSLSDILVACPIQDIYQGNVSKLKYFDRPAFLYHTLNHQFKSDEWIASRWLSQTNFIGLKFSDLPKINFDHLQGRVGALLGEMARCRIFKEGEGVLLAPTQFGYVYEFYLKDNMLKFVRTIDQNVIIDKVSREVEIDSFKRYLERHFQVHLQTLKIKWWGPNSPDGFDVYQTQWLEESLVQNYVSYLNPVLVFKNKISAKWFGHIHFLKKLKNCFYILLFLGLPCIIQNGFDLWKFSKQHQDLVTSIQKLQQIYRPYKDMKITDDQIKVFEEQKSILQILDDFKKTTFDPVLILRKLSPFLKDEVRCHELLWLRGHITIDPKEHTLVLHPVIYNHQTSPQSLVLGITGSSTEVFQSLEKKLRNKFVENQSLKIWTKPLGSESLTMDSFQTSDVDENFVSGLLEWTKNP